MTKMYDIAVIGGGPAGLLSAYTAALRGRRVLLFEKEGRCGKKLDITGKGRCNLTNMCLREEFLANVPENPRFLFAALKRLSPEDTIALFESFGVETKVERGNRVFPKSDCAHDITAALVKVCNDAGVSIVFDEVTAIARRDGAVCGVYASNKLTEAESVVVACGGSSYPKTGSNGSGIRLAAACGHTVIQPKPSLVPLVSPDRLCSDCTGLSLKNVGLSFFGKEKKPVYSEQGEMMFSHFGVTGPVILSASAYLRGEFPYTLFIDLKPALDTATLDRRLLRDFSENLNKNLINSLDALLPRKLIAPFVGLTGINPETKVNSITKEQRTSIVALLKALPVRITGTRPIDEAIVTRGGVSCAEINPKTMESKLVRGLYFVGEVIDVDAYTGGFNLQIAFSTASLAGDNA